MCFVRMLYGLIVASCTLAWLSGQRWLSVWLQGCLLCLSICEKKANGRGGMYALKDGLCTKADQMRIGAYIRMRCRSFSSTYDLNTVSNLETEKCAAPLAVWTV